MRTSRPEHRALFTKVRVSPYNSVLHLDAGPISDPDPDLRPDFGPILAPIPPPLRLRSASAPPPLRLRHRSPIRISFHIPEPSTTGPFFPIFGRIPLSFRMDCAVCSGDQNRSSHCRSVRFHLSLPFEPRIRTRSSHCLSVGSNLPSLIYNLSSKCAS